ncbi:MAG TPA: ChbG/HpnK family deacetylase [Solirubrobacterales bacterium]|nr:ChbG/HpnK family deacetylase [Solirubrobacterales bacterium]
MSGLLILNADDWGYDDPTTAAIVDCYERGGLTSTTQMAFMRGTDAAARVAERVPGLGIGLHLNLVEAYTDPNTPADVRERQRSLIEHARLLRLRRWVYDPFVKDTINQVIADQFRQFIALYGRMPTHVDGHHHCHLAANVLLSPAMPKGTKIRNALSDAHFSNPLTNGLRLAREKLIERRFRTTDYFVSIETTWPGLAGPVPPDKLELARTQSIEVMLHPIFDRELEPLASPEWLDAVAAMPTGTYGDL